MLGKIVEEEKIEASDSEIDTEMANIKKSATENKEDLEKVLNTPQARESIEQTLITRKTIQRLVEIAKGSKETRTTQKRRGKKETKTTPKEEGK